jgi:hypothetical protein
LKITYTIWEDDPAILYTFPEGNMEAYMLTTGGEWVEAHPADIACKAGIVTKAVFKGMVGDGPKPPIPRESTIRRAAPCQTRQIALRPRLGVCG